MVLVSHKYKFIYIKNKKVAGSSVESLFGKYCQDPNKQYNYNHEIDESIDDYGIIGSRLKGGGGTWFNHKPAKLIKKDLGDSIFNEYTKFCVIRNPYDKMVSRYFYNKSEEKFENFVKHTNVSNLDIHSINGKSVCDYYIRYENLEKDIIELCKKLGIEDCNINNLPKHNVDKFRRNNHYSHYYNEETRKIVYENHKEEFELFEYNFDVPPDSS